MENIEAIPVTIYKKYSSTVGGEMQLICLSPPTMEECKEIKDNIEGLIFSTYKKYHYIFLEDPSSTIHFLHLAKNQWEWRANADDKFYKLTRQMQLINYPT